MPSKKPEVRVAQRRVHCTRCPWSGKRAADEVDENPDDLARCPHCNAKVRPGSGVSGRPPLDPDLKRVEQRCSVLPSTLLELEAAGAPYEVAAHVLDEWAKKQAKKRAAQADEE